MHTHSMYILFYIHAFINLLTVRSHILRRRSYLTRRSVVYDHVTGKYSAEHCIGTLSQALLQSKNTFSDQNVKCRNMIRHKSCTNTAHEETVIIAGDYFMIGRTLGDFIQY